MTMEEESAASSSFIAGGVGEAPLLLTSTEGRCVGLDSRSRTVLWESHAYHPLFQGAVLSQSHWKNSPVTQGDGGGGGSSEHAPGVDVRRLSVAGSRSSVTTNESQPEGRWLMIACAWDGTTLFFDEQGLGMEFRLYEEVAAFAAGPYGHDHRRVMVYACFAEGLRLYDLSALPPLHMRSLKEALRWEMGGGSPHAESPSSDARAASAPSLPSRSRPRSEEAMATSEEIENEENEARFALARDDDDDDDDDDNDDNDDDEAMAGDVEDQEDSGLFSADAVSRLLYGE
jgi:hypothetical protein